MPLTKTKGTNTAMVVRIEDKSGVMISLVPRMQAWSSSPSFSRYWEMLSVTMIELSIIIPKARMSPEREMMLSESPHR